MAGNERAALSAEDLNVAEAFVTLFPEGTEEQFNTLIEAMGTGHTDQPERILFAAGPSEAGWNIVQLWDDPAGLERLSEEHLRPAMAKIGARGFPQPPTMVRFQVRHLIAEGAQQAAPR